MKLLRIETHKNEDVYNLEVEDTHCFAATKSNIIIHNCVDSLRYGCMYMQPKSKIGDATRIVGF